MARQGLCRCRSMVSRSLFRTVQAASGTSPSTMAATGLARMVGGRQIVRFGCQMAGRLVRPVQLDQPVQLARRGQQARTVGPVQLVRPVQLDQPGQQDQQGAQAPLAQPERPARRGQQARTVGPVQLVRPVQLRCSGTASRRCQTAGRFALRVRAALVGRT